jgi:cephalosporin hydroxylase
MYALARDMRPAVYVELGVLHGWGIAHVQAASPGTLITGVDLTFKNLAIPRIGLTLIQADSIVAAGLFSGGGADMILFDSDHSSKHMLAEFDAWDPLCRVGCVQLFDDIAAPESLDAWSAIPGPKHEVHELHPEQGFGVRIKPS